MASRAFDRYQLRERIAIGGMAELYKARVVGAHGFARTVAIKKILPQLAADPQFVDMFIDEARITAHLHHPKIVQILELGTNRDQLFIAMEFVDGFDVLSLLRGCKKVNRTVPYHVGVHIVHEVLDALDYAHNATDESGKKLDIVHRDISPGNVLISWRGDVKLTDFGIARAVARQQKTAAGTLKGKYAYMSPELITERGTDARSDLFSTGIVLAELLIGRRLFAARNDLDLLIQVRDVQLDRLDKYGADIPASLRSIVEKSLQRNPDHRYPTAAAFRGALADWLHESEHRVGVAELGELVRGVRDAQLDAPAEPTGPADGVVEVVIEAENTLSGTYTAVSKIRAAKKAEAGREKFARAKAAEAARVAKASAAASEDMVEIQIGEEPTPGQRSSAEIRLSALVPTRNSTFVETSPLALLYELVTAEATGLLVMRRNDVLKKAYFDGGHPHYVSSNLKGERLGEFFVSEGVITKEELARAVQLLDHFDGKLVNTLTGLGLLRPLDATRLVAQQVRSKLIDVCGWQTGEWSWYEREQTPWPALALSLDTREIIGGGAKALPKEMLYAWAQTVADRVPRKAESLPRDAFRIGAECSYVFELLDGTKTVSELAFPFLLPEDQLHFLRMLYLFEATGLAAWA